MTTSDVAAILTGEVMLTKFRAAPSLPHATRSLGLLTTSTKGAGGRTVRMSMTGCPLNRNSQAIIGSRIGFSVERTRS